MKTKNIFVSAFIFVMAALLVTPLMAQNNTYRVDPDVLDSEVEEYHELAEGRDSILINAAKTGKLWRVKLYLSLGADVNAVDSKGKTALMYASENGHDEVVDRLLQEEKIDVNKQDNEGKTALMYAVDSGHEKVVDSLLADERIDVNVQDDKGLSALMLATISLDRDMVYKLISDSRTDKTLKSKKGLIAYNYAEKAYLIMQKVLGKTSETPDKIAEELAKIQEIMNFVRPLSNKINKSQLHKINNGAMIMIGSGVIGGVTGAELEEITRKMKPIK